MSSPYPGHPVRTRKLTQPITPTYSSHEALATFVGTVSCPVCDAVYAPAQSYEQLLYAPMIALESAFLSMCHFCFRCRRPACPACWDAVQGLCGDCMEQLALPFRQELAPFEGMLPMPALHPAVSPPSSSALSHTSSSDNLLRCVYTGRFQQVPDMLSTTTPVPVAPSVPLRASAANARTRLPTTQNDIEAQPTQPPARQQRSQSARTSGYGHAAERILTTLLLLLLSLTILLVLVTSLSSPANDWVTHVLHIDIRAVIVMLWSQFRQLFGQ